MNSVIAAAYLACSAYATTGYGMGDRVLWYFEGPQKEHCEAIQKEYFRQYDAAQATEIHKRNAKQDAAIAQGMKAIPK